MEGWHGVRFRRPVQTTRETIEIIRTVSRGDRLEHAGEIYPLPLPDSDGRACCSRFVAPADVPIYTRPWVRPTCRLTGEAADGWLGNASIPEAADTFLGPLREGADAAGRTLADLDLVAPVAVEITDDDAAGDEAARRHARGYAFTIGAMGARGRNFYNDAFSRLGFADEIARVEQLWQSGHRRRRPMPSPSTWAASPTCSAPRPRSPSDSTSTAPPASPHSWRSPSTAPTTSSSPPSSASSTWSATRRPDQPEHHSHPEALGGLSAYAPAIAPRSSGLAGEGRRAERAGRRHERLDGGG